CDGNSLSPRETRQYLPAARDLFEIITLPHFIPVCDPLQQLIAKLINDHTTRCLDKQRCRNFTKFGWERRMIDVDAYPENDAGGIVASAYSFGQNPAHFAIVQ